MHRVESDVKNFHGVLHRDQLFFIKNLGFIDLGQCVGGFRWFFGS
jgi:hypothetical protein